MDKKLILVVEDDVHLSRIVKELVEETELYEAINAYNGQEALDFFSSNSRALEVACVILDYKMPIMDGPTFLEKLRRSDLPNRDVFIVVLTAYEDKEKWYAATYAQGRALAYIKKDQLESNLLSVLQRAFNGEALQMSQETDDLAMENVKNIVWQEMLDQKKERRESKNQPSQ